jgi:hypothetical protein
MADIKTCYIIGPISEPDSKQRKWANFVRKHIVKPAVTSCGYAEPARADDQDTGLIMQGVIEQMFDAKLVIADLTDHNPNVFYELGIRHCAQKPVIHLIKNGQLPPFDLGNNKAIFIDRDHEVVEQAVNDIKTRIQAIENNPHQFHSDVQLYMRLKQLKVFEMTATIKDKVIIEILKSMYEDFVFHWPLLRRLYEELVEKPKQLSGRYPQTYADAAKLAAGLGEEQNKKLYRKIKR